MSSEHETQRLTEVYASYRESPVVQAQWDERNPGNAAILRERELWTGRLLARWGLVPLTDRRVLEVGCGAGQILASLLKWGATPGNLYGVDLLPDRIEEARRRHPDFHFECANAETLFFGEDSFDLVLVYTVFSSILDQGMARGVASEMDRVLQPQGAILWYDFRYDNPRNPHVRGMNRQAIQRLFPGFALHLRTLTLVPPVARRLGPLTRGLYPVLAALPALRTHYLGLLVRR